MREPAQDAVARGMAERVVDGLEVVDVEEDERQPVVVAAGALDLGAQLLRERLVVEQLGERVEPRPLGELGGGAVEVGDDALDREPVDGVVEAPLEREHVVGVREEAARDDEAPEHAPEQQQLGDDLARGEPERLALARVVAHEGGERAPALEADPRLGVRELGADVADQRRQRAELAEPAEPVERRDQLLGERLADHLERELPRRRRDPAPEVVEASRPVCGHRLRGLGRGRCYDAADSCTRPGG